LISNFFDTGILAPVISYVLMGYLDYYGIDRKMLNLDGREKYSKEAANRNLIIALVIYCAMGTAIKPIPNVDGSGYSLIAKALPSGDIFTAILNSMINLSVNWYVFSKFFKVTPSYIMKLMGIKVYGDDLMITFWKRIFSETGVKWDLSAIRKLYNEFNFNMHEEDGQICNRVVASNTGAPNENASFVMLEFLKNWFVMRWCPKHEICEMAFGRDMTKIGPKIWLSSFYVVTLTFIMHRLRNMAYTNALKSTYNQFLKIYNICSDPSIPPYYENGLDIREDMMDDYMHDKIKLYRMWELETSVFPSYEQVAEFLFCPNENPSITDFAATVFERLD